MATSDPSYREVASELSYKVGSKCCTNPSVSGVDVCTDSDTGADTNMGSGDDRPGGVDCGDDGGENATADVERSNGSRV